MINTDEFTNRIKNIMDFHNLSAAVFADKIGVQRSSISHILSGRNKPSLDFILKITNVFQDVDMYWLVNGVGEFPKKSKAASNLPLISTNIPSIKGEKKQIQRVLIFFTDGTFEEF